MPYEIIRHPTLTCTLVIPLGGDELTIDEIHELNAELNTIMQQAEGPIYQVYDLRTFTRLPRGLLSDLPYFLRTEAMSHRNVGLMIMTHVTPVFLPVMRIIASAHPRIIMLNTLSEAFDYISQLRGQ
jgi:hypothetical protein